MRRLTRLAADLADGGTTAEALVEECLARIGEPDGEGSRAFVHVSAESARVAARAMDALRHVGAEPSPFAGIPVSVKDLFDVRGQATRAGSRALRAPPAERDCPVIAQWRRAGLVLVGRTNMTEFAFSGVGLNPHYGTPLSPWDRSSGRIPGGSSSGAAVSIADAMAHGAVGTDTGGSCRVPAAFCGIVGFKPTQRRLRRDGMVPLSPTLDSVGVLGRSVECCSILFALLGGDEPVLPTPLGRAPRLALPRNYFFDEIEPYVSATFDRALKNLISSGAEVVEVALPELDELPDMNAHGGFLAAESFAWHRELLATRAGDYDPRVLERILQGERQTAADLLDLRTRRVALIERTRDRLALFDALICPTVPLVAPRVAALAADDEYTRINRLVVRNAAAINFLDGCAISVPMHETGSAPAGMMLAGSADGDAEIFRIARWVEDRLRLR